MTTVTTFELTSPLLAISIGLIASTLTYCILPLLNISMKLLNNIKSILSNSMALVAFALIIAVFLGYTYFEPNNKIQILINESLGYSYQAESIAGNTTEQTEGASPQSVIPQEPIAGLKAQWGVIGDFFGGILNPIFALIGLFLLARTLKINSDELSKTRESISQATEIHEQQRFENTFFNLLNVIKSHEDSVLKDIDDTTRKITLLSAHNDSPHLGKKITPSLLLMTFHPNQQPRICQLFQNIYQLLIHIKTSNLTKKNQKKYSNIVRSNINNKTLFLLSINCSPACNPHFKKYKKTLERYSFLEHLNPMQLISEISGREIILSLIERSANNINSSEDLKKLKGDLSFYQSLKSLRVELEKQLNLRQSILEILDSYKEKAYDKSLMIHISKNAIRDEISKITNFISVFDKYYTRSLDGIILPIHEN